MKRKIILSLLLSSCLVGCNLTSPLLQTHMVEGKFIGDQYVFPMNTITNLTMYYQEHMEQVSYDFDNIVNNISMQMDRYHDYDDINNLKTINDSCGKDIYIAVADELFEMLELGVELTKLTKGKFNIAMGSLIDLYSDILSENSSGDFNVLPEQSKIDNAVASIPDFENIDSVIVLDKENKSVKLNQYNGNDVIISLGAIAKGFVIDKTYEYLKSYDYPCLVDSGSSTMMMLNDNPMRKQGKYNISFRNPIISNQQEVSLLTSVSLNGDSFISTSGDYSQNFFYKDKNDNTKLMHHIIDPFKGISNNYFRNVSLISTDASLALLDALSTTIFNVEKLEDVYRLIDEVEEIYNCNIAFMLVTPYRNSFEEFDVYLSKSFNELLIDDFSKQVKSINVVDGY